MHSTTIRSVLILAAALTGLAGCGRDDEPTSSGLDTLTDNAGILQYVPADTPYVIAAPAKLPDDVLDKIEANADSIYGAYEQVLKATLADIGAEMEAEGADEQQVAGIMNVLGELSGLMRSERLRAAGVPRGAQFAFYGVGLLPVVRVELEDTDAFERTIAEFEESAGQDMTIGEIDGQSYRYVGDDEGRLIVAVLDDTVVISIAPTTLSDESLRALLGIDKPAQSIAQTGALADLAAEYDYRPYALGYVDVESIAATFLDVQTGINAELLALGEYDRSILSDTCRGELREMSEIVPRMVTGYTDISVSSMQSNTVFEVRSDLAQGLKTLTAPVPGLGTDHGGLASFGMSFDLMAAREFYEARLDAMEADPYQCELLFALQAGVEQGRMALQQPMLPIIYSFKGFVAVLDDIDGLDFETQQPPTDIEARLLVATDNAQGLLAMGAMASPELAGLEIEPNGEPVAFTPAQMAGMVDASYLAMTETALGLGIGDTSADGLSDLLGSSAGDPPPFFSIHVDGARYYSMINDAIQAGQAQAAASGGEELSPEMQEALSQVMTGVGDMIDRVSVDVTFTDRGIEMPARITLAD